MQGKPLVLLLSVLYGSAFIAGFNENLVNMALVSIMAEYGVDSVTAQWLVTGYMIVATVVVTCMAFLYRRFHVRTLFFGAAGLSIVGSAMGLVAPSFELLLVARLVQAWHGHLHPAYDEHHPRGHAEEQAGHVPVRRRLHDHVRPRVRPGGVRRAGDGVRMAQQFSSCPSWRWRCWPCSASST